MLSLAGTESRVCTKAEPQTPLSWAHAYRAQENLSDLETHGGWEGAVDVKWQDGGAAGVN